MNATDNAKCHTCTQLSSVDNLLLETDHWRVILANEQSYVGRSFVTLRNHKASLSELSRAEWQDFENLVVRLESGYEKAFGSGRPFNWACMMNYAFQEPDPQPHVHWHLRPRHSRPVVIDGHEFTDPDYAHHYSRSRERFVDKELFNKIVSLIKQHI